MRRKHGDVNHGILFCRLDPAPGRRAARGFVGCLKRRHVRPAQSTGARRCCRKTAAAAMPSAPSAASPLKAARRCETSTPDLRRANCRPNCARAWFPGTGRCRRSTFPTRTSTRSWPISTRFRSGNSDRSKFVARASGAGLLRRARFRSLGYAAPLRLLMMGRIGVQPCGQAVENRWMAVRKTRCFSRPRASSRSPGS